MPGDAKTLLLLCRPCHGCRGYPTLQDSSIPLRARSICPRLRVLKGRDIAGGIDVTCAGTKLVVHEDPMLMLHQKIAWFGQRSNRILACTHSDKRATRHVHWG